MLLCEVVRATQDTPKASHWKRTFMRVFLRSRTASFFLRDSRRQPASIISAICLGVRLFSEQKMVVRRGEHRLQRRCTRIREGE
jgi:hypothetical protein